ncbi:MAG: hypothetical protein OSA97_13400 [Nevskia sp.]|nr:hypothetical protein [Nevskia sp.]
MAAALHRHSRIPNHRLPPHCADRERLARTNAKPGFPHLNNRSFIATAARQKY